MVTRFSINYDRLIINLFCAYAFFIPLEKVLEVAFDIDTVFKPYRVVALLTIGAFTIKSLYRWTPSPSFKRDLFLYMLFLYGTIITLYRMITTNFQMKYLINDLFQMGIYLCMFIVLRHIEVEKKDIRRMLLFLIGGMMVNTLYISGSLLIFKVFTRNSGFMDNPNYLAFGLVIVLVFILIYRELFEGFVKRTIWWLMIILSIYIFILAGSRSAFGVLVMASVLIFWYSTILEKLLLTFLISGLAFFLLYFGEEHVKTTGPLILINRLQKNSEDDPRLPVWKGTFEVAEQDAFIGLGVGQFKSNFPKYFRNVNNELIQKMVQTGYFLSPHSDYFAILVVYGIFGLVCYLVFIFFNLRKMFLMNYINRFNQSNKFYKYVFISFVAVVLFGITAENFNSALYWIVLSTSTKLDLV